MTRPTQAGRARLTEEERETLAAWDVGHYFCACLDTCPSLPCDNDRSDLFVAVESIVAARVEDALAEAERRIHDRRGRGGSFDKGCPCASCLMTREYIAIVATLRAELGGDHD